jgi:hypothetical protein
MTHRRRKAYSVYTAEDRVFDGTRHSIPIGLGEMRAIAVRYGVERVEYRPRCKGRDTGGTYYPPIPGRQVERILIGRDAGLYVLLHEIAHSMSRKEDRGHGAAWRAAYVKLVEVEISAWWARRLRRAFRLRGDQEMGA